VSLAFLLNALLIASLSNLKMAPPGEHTHGLNQNHHGHNCEHHSHSHSQSKPDITSGQIAQMER
jgi:Spy/CpxP family protein refolding chaperone